MRSRQPRSVMKNTYHLLKLSEINCFGGGGSLKVCSANDLSISVNQTNASWLFPLQGRGFNPSSFLTQSLTNNSIDPTPENLSFASHCESQLDFLPSPSRGEGNASLANIHQTNLGHPLSLQERYRLLLKLCSLPQHPFSGRDVTLVTERERVRCLPVRANILQANLTPSLGGGERVLLALSGRFSC